MFQALLQGVTSIGGIVGNTIVKNKQAQRQAYLQGKMQKQQGEIAKMQFQKDLLNMQKQKQLQAKLPMFLGIGALVVVLIVIIVKKT